MRVFNFAAGPAMLPSPVLDQAKRELEDWQHLGMSVMELSHRSKAFMAVAKAVTKDWVYLQDKAAAASYYSHTRSSSLSNLGTVA